MNTPPLVRAVPGDTAELTARVMGHPDPVIAWAKAGEAVTNSEKYTVSTN